MNRGIQTIPIPFRSEREDPAWRNGTGDAVGDGTNTSTIIDHTILTEGV